MKKNEKIILIVVLCVVAIPALILIGSIIITLIAIPASSHTIKGSKRATYVDAAKKYLDAGRIFVISNPVSSYDNSVSYYIPTKCLDGLNEYAGDSSMFKEAYVVFKYSNGNFEYYWISKGDNNLNIPNLTQDKKLSVDSIVSENKGINTNQLVEGTNKRMMLNSNDCSTFE